MKTSASPFLTLFALATSLLLTGCGGGSGNAHTGSVAALQVVSSNPSDGQTRVDTGTAITVGFSATLDPATINVSSFRLDGPSGPIVGTVSLDPAGTTATFTPDSALPNQGHFIVTLTTAIRSTTGQSLSADHLIRFSTAPWTRQEGTAGDEAGRAVAADAQGNLYVAGYTTGALNGQRQFGGRDMFVIKHDPSGQVLWTRQFGTAADDEAAALAIDAAGNLIVAGTTGGTFPGQTSAGGTDGVILRLDADGALLDTLQFGTGGDDTAEALAIAGNGNLIVTGKTTAAFIGNNSGGTDAYIQAFDTQGNVLWTDQLGSSAQDSGNALAIDGTGNVYLAGTTGGSLDGDTITLSFNDIFLAAYEPNGTRSWLRQLRTLPPDTTASLSNESARALAIDGGGNLYIAGDRLSFSATSGLDMLLVKCDSLGNPVWAKTFGTADDDRLNGLFLDAQGNLFAAGQSVGAYAGTSAGLDDIVVEKRNATGNLLWRRQMGSPAADLANGLTLTANGDLVVTGLTGASLDGNPALGGDDLFLLRYAPDGSLY